MGTDTSDNISVVIPAYNAAGTIGRALDSVIAQTHPAREIIVVDDGSTDRTAQVVSEYGGRVEYLYQDNAGPGAARNAGIRAARGEWIAFLDADDEWLPHRLALQVDLLGRHPDLAWVTGRFERCHCDHKRPNPPAPGDQDPIQDFFSLLGTETWGCTDTMLVRKHIVQQAGPFSTERFTEDLDMWIRIACLDPRIGVCHEALAVYHVCTPESLIKRHAVRDGETLIRFFTRTLEFAERHGRTASYRPAASHLLRRWARAMLFHGYGHEARKVLTRFGTLLPVCHRAGLYVLTIYPSCTGRLLRLLARALRPFRSPA